LIEIVDSNLPHLYFSLQLGVTLFRFHQDLWN